MKLAKMFIDDVRSATNDKLKSFLWIPLPDEINFRVGMRIHVGDPIFYELRIKEIVYSTACNSIAYDLGYFVIRDNENLSDFDMEWYEYLLEQGWCPSDDYWECVSRHMAEMLLVA